MRKPTSNQDIADLQSEEADLCHHNGDLHSEVADLCQDIAELQSEKADLCHDIANLHSEEADLCQDILTSRVWRLSSIMTMLTSSLVKKPPPLHSPENRLKVLFWAYTQ